MREWKEYTLGDLYKVSSGLSKSADQFGFGHTFISFKDVFWNYFIPENPEGLVNSNEKEQSTCNVSKGDILITRTSESLEEVGMTAVALKDYPNSTFNGFSKRLRLKKDAPIEISPLFMGYLLRTRFFRKSVANYATMTTRASLNGESIQSIPLKFPAIHIQEEIGKTLHSLEKKIAILKQQNKDLEELAQTLFKCWFVEFEFPDENGEPYKSSGGKMVESELGEIPEGWRVGFFNELIADSIGGDYGKEELIDDFTEETTCLRGTDLPDMKTGLPLRAPVRYIKASKLNKCKLESGDLVIEISGGTEGQSTGRAIYINDDILSHFDRPMTCVNFCRILRPQEKVYSYFTYLFIDHLYRHRVFFNLENGSTGIKNLDLKTLLNDYEIQLPINNLILRFDSVVNKNFIKIQRNNKEIQTLTELRDTLLPKLMSGELKVKAQTDI